MSEKAAVYVRCDGNAVIGAGHIMRCLTITDCMGSETQVTFLCADEASAELVRGRNGKALVLGTDGKNMEEELPVLESLFAEREKEAKKRVILVDSYFVTKEYLQKLGHFGKVIYMDDLCEETYPVDGVINYNAFAGQQEYADRYPGKRCLIGPAFIPLRPQFLQKKEVEDCQERQFEKDEHAEEKSARDGFKKEEYKKDEFHILLTTGGGDKDNIAGKIMDQIYPLFAMANKEKQKKIVLHVIAGQFSPNYAVLQEFAASHEGVEIHSNVQNMGELMRSCNLGITAGGTTVYEMLAVLLPVICFAYAKNQEALVAFVGENQIGYSAGNYHETAKETLKKIADCVNLALEDITAFQKRAKAAGTIVDGLGAQRLAHQIECFYEL